MELVKIKLEKIQRIWNHFVWNYKYIQNKIRFTEEIRKDYCAEIFDFFLDTIPLIDSYLKTDSVYNRVFNTIGFLQIIYVQQDLVDELLHIFRLNYSSNQDKNPNRTIRNELIGHPISRKSRGENRELKSSVFFGNELSKSKIHYVKYSIESNFKGVENEYLTEDIIKSHIDFLNKYFDKILIKLKKIIRKFSKNIKEIKTIEKHTDFKKLSEIIAERYENFYGQREIYAKERILKIEQLKDTHPRYKFSFDLFKKELFEYIDDTNKGIKELLQKEEIKTESDIDKTIKIIPKFINSSKNETDKDKGHVNMKNLLPKLYDNHPIFGINYFKKKFKDNLVILCELDNMELNQHNKMEYYCSFEYISSIIKK